MTRDEPLRQVTRAKFLRTIAATSTIVGVTVGQSDTASATPATRDPESAAETVVDPHAIQTDTQTVVDFDWSHPRCPEHEVGDLGQYFFGDLAYPDGFHIDDGGGAREQPDGCVLRTDGDDVLMNSLPDGHPEQPATLEHYPRRGEAIVFEHYVHRMGSNMEFRFGVQEDTATHYAVRFETESDAPAIYLLRSDDGTPTVLAEVRDVSYSNGQFHDFTIDWQDDEIAVALLQDGRETTISANDDTYDRGGIGFAKENSGIIQFYTHFWNNVEVVTRAGG